MVQWGSPSSEDSSFFKTSKGLRQGDPLSPILFNLIGDVLTRMLLKAADCGLIKGLLTDFAENGIMALQYADDMVLFSSCEVEHLRNLKCILSCFEKLSSMRINFHKSEVIPMNLSDGQIQEVSHILSCPVGAFPMKYLGVPLHFDKLRKEDIQPLIDKILKRIAGWRGRLLSLSGKLVLIKTCLASIPVYLMSVIKFPSWAITLINSQMAHCLWSDSENRKKLHLVNWETVTISKEFGGLGVPDLRQVNICLLASWIRRYSLDGNKLWKRVFDFKYNTNRPNILSCVDIGASNLWKGVKWAARVAKMGYRWKLGNGNNVKFWEDVWLGTSSLAIQLWEIYCLINEQFETVANLWDGVNLRCTFRSVDGRLFRMWQEVVQIASTIVFTDEPDSLVWQFSSSGVYSSHSLYKVINFRGVQPVFEPAIWKIHVPPRLHLFLWLFSKNKILTRDNLSKRMQLDSTECLFCQEQESIRHLFFDCCVARKVWSELEGYLSFKLGDSYLDIASCWLCNKKFLVRNMLTTAVLWAIWKLRNSICFQNVGWRNLKQLWQMAWCMLGSWKVLCPVKYLQELESYIAVLENLRSRPERIAHLPQVSRV